MSVKLVEVVHDGGKAGEVMEDPSGRRGAGHIFILKNRKLGSVLDPWRHEWFTAEAVTSLALNGLGPGARIQIRHQRRELKPSNGTLVALRHWA